MNKIHPNIGLSSAPCGFLGNNVKSQAKSGDYERKLRLGVLKQRFSLLWKSQRILRPIASQNVLGCMHNTMLPFVELEKSDGHANFGGVVTCKSKHVCPVESPSIARIEAGYIRDAIYKCRKEGGDCYMLTLTYQHNSKMSLAYSLGMFKRALIKFWSCGSVKRFFKTYFFGRITSSECTWSSANGWHPHEHILLFGERGLCGNPLVDVGSFLSHFWLRALHSVGMDGLEGVASDFQSASAVKNYLTKMSLELSMSNFKFTRRKGGLTPFQILDKSNGKDCYADLWREYYLATKGKRVIVWSDGLKSRFGIDQLTDDQIADEANKEISDEIKQVLYIEASDWRNRVSASSDNLAFLKACSLDEVFNFLDSLGVSYYGGDVLDYGGESSVSEIL